MRALDRVTMSGSTPAACMANSWPGAAEAGEDLVEDQQHAVLVGQAAQGPQHLRRVEQHAAAPWTRGSVRIAAISRACCASMASSAASKRGVHRQVGDHLAGQDAGEQAVHALLRIAHRHRGQGVAVIAAPERRGTWCAHVHARRLIRNCSAIFMAISTDTEPDSAKKA